MKITETFAKLLEESVIIRGVLTVLLVATCSYLWIAARPVPTELLVVMTGAVGFYFGAMAKRVAAPDSGATS